MNHLSNNRAELLADEYGDIDAQIKALEEEKKAVREELLDYLFDVPVVGLRWTVTRNDVTSTRLDNDAIRQYLGDKVHDFEKKSKSVTIRVKQTKVLGRVSGGE